MADVTLTLKFPIDPPNTQAVVDAINSSLKNVGVTVGQVAKGHEQVQKETNKLTGFIKEQRFENRQQNFLLGESRQAIGALSLGITAFGAAGSASMKKVTDTIGTGIVAFQGFDFLLAGLGVSGTMGLAIAGVAALATALIPLISNLDETGISAKAVSEELQKQFDLRVKLGEIPPPKHIDELKKELAITERSIAIAKHSGAETTALETHRLQLLTEIQAAEQSVGDIKLKLLKTLYPEAFAKYDEEKNRQEALVHLQKIRLDLLREGNQKELSDLDALTAALKRYYESTPVDKIEAQDLKLIESGKKKEVQLKKVNENLMGSREELTAKMQDSINAEIEGWRMLTEQYMQLGAMQYEAGQNFGVQMNRLINERIRAYIALAVAEYLQTLVPLTGPLSFFLLPAAGLAMQALLEGLIPKFGGGGAVPGSGNQDSVLALLTPGERVIRKSVSQEHGGFLDALNAGLIRVNRFANGGGVGSFVATPTSGGDSGLTKEFKKFTKQLSKMKSNFYVQSNFDIQKYEKANKKMERSRLAFQL